MLPNSLALIDDDKEYTEFLSLYLQDRGIQVQTFADSAELLTHPLAFDYEFYIVDLMMPGVSGLELIKILRRRSTAGLLVVSGRVAPDVFEQAITCGADMYLSKPVKFNQVLLAIEAVHRRIGTADANSNVWKLDRRARQLVAPDTQRVDLSESDLQVMESFLEADGAVVTRETLRLRLGYNADEHAPEALNATIYRLRRRIGRATTAAVPLQSISRVGYAFRAPLQGI